MNKIELNLTDRQLAQLKHSLENDSMDNDQYNCKVIDNILAKIQEQEV
jgi:hypothetical protein